MLLTYIGALRQLCNYEDACNDSCHGQAGNIVHCILGGDMINVPFVNNEECMCLH